MQGVNALKVASTSTVVMILIKIKFVCALSEKTADTIFFTSYSSRGSSDMYHKTRIWEAVRVTSAASFFFNPIKIGLFEEEFVDGAVKANNPVMQLWNEVKNM